MDAMRKQNAFFPLRLAALFIALLCLVSGLFCVRTGVAFASEPAYEDDHILIILEEGVSAADVQSIFSTLDWVDKDRLPDALSDESLGDTVVALPLAFGVSVEDALTQVLSCSVVDAAQPDYIYELPEPIDSAEGEESFESAPEGNRLRSLTEELLGTRLLPNDPFLSDHPTHYWHLESIDAFSAWQRATPAGSVTVAVLDSGCLLTHEDLSANILSDDVYDASTGIVGPEGFHDAIGKGATGHGTHVAGIIAAVANNGVGTAGVSYNAQILPIKVFTDGTATKKISASSSSVRSAYVYVMDLAQSKPELNIRVINMSIGSYEAPDTVLQESIRAAQSRGIVTVCAAGNGDGNTGVSDYSWPSDFPEAFSVTALSTDGESPTAFSDYNIYKDICAPGQLIYSTLYTNVGAYGFKSGTSMAAPVVSGALAFLWSAYPDTSVEDMRNVLLATAAPLTVPSGREGMYGAGRLDVDAALRALETGGTWEVGDFCSGVYEIAYTPSSTAGSESFFYQGKELYYAADQGQWITLTAQRPTNLQQDDFSSESGTEAAFVARPGHESASARAGDCNASGFVNIVDAQIAYDRATGHSSFNEQAVLSWLVSDVNGDGALNAVDAFAIQYAVHRGGPGTA